MNPRPARARTAPRTGSGLGRRGLVLTLAAAAAATLLAVGVDLAAGGAIVLPLLAIRGGESRGTLENDTRRAVYEHVRDQPGTPIAGVAEAVDVSHSTATYHLDTLAESGLVVSLEDGNKRRFFPNAGAYDEAERRCLAVLENEGTRRALAAVARREPTTRSELASSLDVSIPTVNWHLERLDDCGFLDQVDAGGSVELRLERSRTRSVLAGLLEKLEGSDYDGGELEALARELEA